MLNKKYALSLFLLSAISVETKAADFVYQSDIILAHYDNLNLENQPSESDSSYEVGMGLRVLEDTSNLLASINLDVSYIDYKNNVASDTANGQLYSRVVWRIKPEVFDWVLVDNFTQSVIDPLDSSAPDNRQNINVLSTGPDYNIRINSNNNLRLEGRFEKYNYENGIDNDRLFSAMRWVHDFNSYVTLSINNEAEVTKFENDATNPKTRRNDFFLSSNYSRGLTSVDAEYGITQIKDDSTRDLDSDRYLFSITSTRTRTSVVTLTYEKLLSDTGNEVQRIDPSQQLIGNVLGSVANDVFVTERYYIEYVKNLTVGELNIDLSIEDISYDQLTILNESSESAYINLIWNLPRGNNIIINANNRKTLFDDPATNREDIDRSYSAAFLYNLNRNINVNIEAISLSRDSSIIAESYDDFRVLLSLRYASH